LGVTASALRWLVLEKIETTENIATTLVNTSGVCTNGKRSKQL
jgi:hypothetical protein